MVYLGFPINIIKTLRHGWTLERDEATGMYVYGSVPRLVYDTYSEMKKWSKLSFWKASNLASTAKSRLAKTWRWFSHQHPRITFALTAAAATVGYFVGIGVAWAVALKVLRWINIFP